MVHHGLGLAGQDVMQCLWWWEVGGVRVGSTEGWGEGRGGRGRAKGRRERGKGEG